MEKTLSKHIVIDYKPLEILHFSGGETQVFNDNKEPHEIICYATNNQALIELMLVKQSIISVDELIVPYLPYARQDRQGKNGEPNAVKMATEIINMIPYKNITVFDCHSDVGVALLKSEVCNMAAHDLFNLNSCRAKYIIAPDAGATKRAFAQAEDWQLPFVQAAKHRDVATGNITHTSIDKTFNGECVRIVDDICDGGRTFIELAKVLKAQGVGSIELQVTHGIFSQGFEVFEGLIDKILYTNSRNHNPELAPYHNFHKEITS